jgi:NAD(P)-dependent dehydrogenase (short-subunit alcohol dehydrogenase family)
MERMQLLEHKWALVTGSSRGVGQQIVRGLAQRKCNVIVHGRDMEHLQNTLNLLEPLGVEVHAVAGDLATAAGVQALIDGVRQGPGHVDILYNNAAVQNPWKLVWDTTMDEWLHTFQINLFALIALCNAFAPSMQQRGYGRIINLTSGIKDVPNLAPYSVSKAAVDKYTRDLAAELRGTNVLANTLDPGWLRTDMGGPNAEGEPETVLPGALVPALLEDHGPSGRLFAAQDVKYLA